MADRIKMDNVGGDTISIAGLGVEAKYIPEGWDSAQEFLDHATKLFDSDMLFDKDNREWAMEDLRFAAGDQWDAEVKQSRENAFRPCLTINVLPQFIGQVIGDRRINKTEIKVRPFRDGTKAVADARSGLIKSIELFSRAERVYDATCEDQVTCGIGNFRVDLDYTANDVFEQDILLRHIPNPLAVVWDRMSVDPTGRDARHCFVTDTLPKEVFEDSFPDVQIPLVGFGSLYDDTTRSTRWMDGNTVKITEFWELVDKPATFALFTDGSVQDVTGKAPEEYMENVYVDQATGLPRVRKSTRTYARMHLITSFAILSECYEIPLTRLPIIRAEGRVIRVGDDRIRFGLVRFAKDSQRLKNYWRSVAAETLALAPKAQWTADAGAVEGREKDWRDSHNSGDPLLIFNKGQQKPERVDPPAFPSALMQEAQMNQQDIKDTTGLQDASLGVQSNEVSGKAINARKMEGDVATVIYHDNLNHAILEAGDVINQLIPIAYDSVRIVRIIGEDDKHRLQKINDPSDPDAIDITQGKYDVVLDTGPSFTTQRQEALDGMMTLIQTAPELMTVIGDLVAEKTDWPGSTEIAARLKKMVPPQVLSPEEQQAQQGPPDPAAQEQQAQQEAVQHAQLQEAAAQLQHAEEMRQIEKQQAMTDLENSQNQTAISQQKARQAAADADAAEAKAEQAKIAAAYKPLEHEQQLQHGENDHLQRVVQGGITHDQQIEHAERSQAGNEEMNAERIAAMKQKPEGQGAKGSTSKGPSK